GGDLRRRARQDGLAALGLRGEDDLSGRDLPHVGRDRLAREDDPREAHLERLEPLGLVVAPRLEERAPAEAEGAEAVEDRAIVAAELREVRVGMQRVHVAREAVDQGLLRERLRRHGLVGRPVGRDVARPARAAVTTEAALAAREDARRVPEEETTL